MVMDRQREHPRPVNAGGEYRASSIRDALVDWSLPNLDRLQNILDELEEKALEDPSRETANTIHRFRRDLLVLRNQLRPQRDAFAQLSRTDLAVFRKETRDYLRDIYDHMIQALDRI